MSVPTCPIAEVKIRLSDLLPDEDDSDCRGWDYIPETPEEIAWVAKAAHCLKAGHRLTFQNGSWVCYRCDLSVAVIH